MAGDGNLRIVAASSGWKIDLTLFLFQPSFCLCMRELTLLVVNSWCAGLSRGVWSEHSLTQESRPSLVVFQLQQTQVTFPLRTYWPSKFLGHGWERGCAIIPCFFHIWPQKLKQGASVGWLWSWKQVWRGVKGSWLQCSSILCLLQQRVCRFYSNWSICRIFWLVCPTRIWLVFCWCSDKLFWEEGSVSNIVCQTLVTNFTRQFLPTCEMQFILQELILDVIFSTVLLVHLMVCFPQVRGTPRLRLSSGCLEDMWRVCSSTFLIDSFGQSFSYIAKILERLWFSDWFALVKRIMLSANIRREIGGAFSRSWFHGLSHLQMSRGGA